MTELSILCNEGDTKLTWDHENPAEVADIRETILDMKQRGFSFFLTDGSPADEAAAGQGTLIVRRITVEELIVPIGPDEEVTAPVAAGKKRGRPLGATRNVVAVPQQRGG